MEYKSKKSNIFSILVVAIIFLGLGAAVLYFFIIQPGLQQDNVPPPSSSSSSGETASSSSSSGEAPASSSSSSSSGETASSSSSGGEGTASSSSSSSSGETASSSSSSSSSSGTIVPSDEGQAAVWSLTKRAVLTCGTNTNLATVLYTITLQNSGTVSGKVSNLTDTVENIVTSGMLSQISMGGVFNSTTHQLVWDSSGEGFTLAAGASQDFVYQVTFDRRLGQFRSVQTVATALPADGSLPPQAASNTTVVGCQISGTAFGDENWTLPIVLITISLMVLALIELNTGIISKKIYPDRKKQLEETILGPY